MTFLRHLFGVAKAHPLAFVLFIVAVVLVLGGLVWKGLSFLFTLVSKVPVVGPKAAAAGASAATKIASATGSA